MSVLSSSLAWPEEDTSESGGTSFSEWRTAKHTAVRRQQWVLLNITDFDSDLNACLNSEFLLHPRYADLVQHSSFLLCQYHPSENDGRFLISELGIQSLPSLHVIDPYDSSIKLELPLGTVEDWPDMAVALSLLLNELVNDQPSPHHISLDKDALSDDDSIPVISSSLMTGVKPQRRSDSTDSLDDFLDKLDDLFDSSEEDESSEKKYNDEEVSKHT